MTTSSEDVTFTPGRTGKNATLHHSLQEQISRREVFRQLRSFTNIACSAGVFFERAICSRKRHVETSRREEEMGRVKGFLFLLSPIFHCHKIKDGGYNNITNTNKVSPTQNTPALQAITNKSIIGLCQGRT